MAVHTIQMKGIQHAQFDVYELIDCIKAYHEFGYPDYMMLDRQHEDLLPRVHVVIWHEYSELHDLRKWGRVLQPVLEEGDFIWFVGAPLVTLVEQNSDGSWRPLAVALPPEPTPKSVAVYRLSVSEMSFGDSYWMLTQDEDTSHGRGWRFHFDTGDSVEDSKRWEDLLFLLEEVRAVIKL